MTMYAIAIMMAIVANTYSKPSGEEVTCGETEMAKFNLTFEVFWTEERFPKQFPNFRPHAQWSKLVGRTHSPIYTLWREDEVASVGVKEMAELGSTENLELEIQGRHGILDIFSTPNIDIGQGSISVNIFADSFHSKVSMLSRLIPSPDWFVGVDSFNLCEDGKWVEDVHFDLQPYDAGTDRGFTFTAPNWPENPPKTISIITSQFPNHPANSFYYPELDELPTIARMHLQKVPLVSEDKEEETSGSDINSNESTYKPILPVYNHEEVERPIPDVSKINKAGAGGSRKAFSSLFGPKRRPNKAKHTKTTPAPADENIQNEQPARKTPKKPRRKQRKNRFQAKQYEKKVQKVEEEKAEEEEEKKEEKKERIFSLPGAPRHCKVSEWQEWSACTKTCGYGTRMRMRNIIAPAENGGRPCPVLKQQEMCGSMSSCSWSHFNSNNWGRRRERAKRRF